MGTSGFKTEDNKAIVHHVTTNANSSGNGNCGGASSCGSASGSSSTTSGVVNASAATNMNVDLCLVCGDRASGRHYGAISCEGCKGFFKRSIRKQLGYQCRGAMNCEVTKHHRNRCQFCRLQKCIASGMRSDSVQHERKPIVDKKEFVGSSFSGSSTSTAASSSTVSGGKSNSPGVYTPRAAKQIFLNPNLNTTSTTANNPSVSTAAATAAPNYLMDNNISLFPVNLNFAEFTKRLMFATQQQEQQQQLSSQSQTAQSLCYSPDLPKAGDEDEDDSMDNNSTLCLQNLSATANNNNSQNINFNIDALPSPTTAVGLIQTSLDKRVIDKALQLLISIQNQLTKLSLTSGSGNTSANSNNPLTIKNEIDNDEMAEGSTAEDENDLDDSITGGIPKIFIANESIFESDLISPSHAPFNLEAPTLVSTYLNMHYVCETGSRIIFLSIYWLRKVEAFNQLDEGTQIKLLRACWPGLLAIALAQVREISINTVISTLVTNVRQLADIEKIEPQKILKLSEHTARLNGFLQEASVLDTDEMEYALLRLVILFNPHMLQSLRESNVRDYVRRVQMYVLASLRKHIATNMQTNEQQDIEQRFSALIMILLPLGALESETVEELFFSNLVGQVQIDNMIPHILTLSSQLNN